jgi:hypothetical protein
MDGDGTAIRFRGIYLGARRWDDEREWKTRVCKECHGNSWILFRTHLSPAAVDIIHTITQNIALRLTSSDDRSKLPPANTASLPTILLIDADANAQQSSLHHDEKS